LISVHHRFSRVITRLQVFKGTQGPKKENKGCCQLNQNPSTKESKQKEEKLHDYHPKKERRKHAAAAETLMPKRLNIRRVGSCGAADPRDTSKHCTLKRGHSRPHSWSWTRTLNDPVRSKRNLKLKEAEL
jgi:hypothetical protein